MVDTTVHGAVQNGLDTAEALWGPYWSDVSTGVIVFVDSGNDLNFARTTDKGANWSATQIQAGTVNKLAAWYDKETPGDTGTLVHLSWTETSSVRYVTVDVSDAAVGTIRTVDSSVSLGAAIQMRMAITKVVNGTIIVAFSTQSDIECYKSTDNFATAGTDIADVFEAGSQEDYVLLFPANIDAGDVCALFWDRSANAISLKMYDDSGDSWTETSIAGSMTDDAAHINMDGVVRHSDSHVLFAAHSSDDSSGDDLRTWDLTVDSIASPTVTAKANIFTNQGESSQVGVFINQQADDVYVAYLKGGTWQSTVDAVYHISTDDMDSWGAEQAYSEDTSDDIRRVHGGRLVGDDGGRYQPAFYNIDLTEIFVNETNDVEIGSGEPPAEPTKGLRLLRGMGR